MHFAAVFIPATAPDQPLIDQPIHQFDRAVVLNLQPFGDEGDARLRVVGLPLQCQQKLMMLRLNAGLSRCFFAEAHETADLVAKLGESLVVGLFNFVVSAHSHS